MILHYKVAPYTWRYAQADQIDVRIVPIDNAIRKHFSNAEDDAWENPYEWEDIGVDMDEYTEFINTVPLKERDSFAIISFCVGHDVDLCIVINDGAELCLDNRDVYEKVF